MQLTGLRIFRRDLPLDMSPTPMDLPGEAPLGSLQTTPVTMLADGTLLDESGSVIQNFDPSDILTGRAQWSAPYDLSTQASWWNESVIEAKYPHWSATQVECLLVAGRAR